MELSGPVPATAAPSARVDRRPGLARYLALPDRLPPRVRALAERFTSGATTPYARAAALERAPAGRVRLRRERPSGGSIDALDHFLFATRPGYCEQFAGAFAAMARAVGLPARVAVGFTPGELRRRRRRFRVRGPGGPRLARGLPRRRRLGRPSSPRPAGPYRTPTPGCWPTPSSSGWRRRDLPRPGVARRRWPGSIRAAAPVSTPAPGTARAGSPGRSTTPASSGGSPPRPSASSSCLRWPRSGAGASVAALGPTGPCWPPGPRRSTGWARPASPAGRPRPRWSSPAGRAPSARSGPADASSGRPGQPRRLA